MKTLRVQNLVAIALACGLTFTGTNLFAQQAGSSVRVPVGPPVPALTQPVSWPKGPVAHVPSQHNRHGGVIIGQSYDGIDFFGSNCGCLTPDNKEAVGNKFV